MPIVESVGSIHRGNANEPDLNEAIEAAKTEAILRCYAEGNLDPDYIRQAQIDARDAVLAEFYPSEPTDDPAPLRRL